MEELALPRLFPQAVPCVCSPPQCNAIDGRIPIPCSRNGVVDVRHLLVRNMWSAPRWTWCSLEARAHVPLPRLSSISLPVGTLQENGTIVFQAANGQCRPLQAACAGILPRVAVPCELLHCSTHICCCVTCFLGSGARLTLTNSEAEPCPVVDTPPPPPSVFGGGGGGGVAWTEVHPAEIAANSGEAAITVIGACNGGVACESSLPPSTPAPPLSVQSEPPWTQHCWCNVEHSIGPRPRRPTCWFRVRVCASQPTKLDLTRIRVAVQVGRFTPGRRDRSSASSPATGTRRLWWFRAWSPCREPTPPTCSSR